MDHFDTVSAIHAAISSQIVTDCFENPENPKFSSKLDAFIRNGVIQVENVKEILNLYFENAKTTLLKKSIQFVILINNLVRFHGDDINTRDLIKLDKIWAFLEVKKNLNYSILPQFRRRLRQRVQARHEKMQKDNKDTAASSNANENGQNVF